MKRFLALLLTLVMLVSVCGLQAFAADGDTTADTGDELVVYTRSGATRTFHVGDTFSYTYWFRLTSGSVNKITGHVLYDSECLTVNADGCKFPNMSSASTKNNAGDFEFGDSFTTSAGGVFATAAPQVMANISFTVTRGGTAYLTTMIERLEIRKSNNDKSELVTNFQNKTWSPARYSTFDYLQDEKPTAASSPLSASSDVAWYYAVDAETGTPVPAGVTFELSGTAGNGEHIERTAVSDAYGFVGFGTVPYGTYYIQTRTASDATVAYIISDGSRVLPDVQDGKLQMNHTLHYRTADPSELRSLTVTFEWTNELIAPDELYTKDRPSSVYMEMSRAMLVTVLYRMNGSPSVAGMTMPFQDVPGNAWYTDAVTWAYNCGIVSGMNPTTFAPMVSITREQMMTMFYGYAVYMDYNTMAVADLSAFPDGGDVSSWAEAEMGWAVANTLISGVKESDGVYLRPQGTATRAEAAAILHRFDQWRVNAVVTGK